MNKEIRLKITADGRVEIDSTVFKDCKEIASHFEKLLGRTEKFYEKDEQDASDKLHIDIGE